MTCERSTILEILREFKIKLPPIKEDEEGLGKLVALFSDRGATVKQRETILNIVIGNILNKRKAHLEDSFGNNIPPEFNINFTPLDVIRGTRKAATNIMSDSIGIGKPGEKKFLKDLLDVTGRKLAPIFEKSRRLADWRLSEDGKAFHPDSKTLTWADEAILDFIENQTESIRRWLDTGNKGNPILPYMDQSKIKTKNGNLVKRQSYFLQNLINSKNGTANVTDKKGKTTAVEFSLTDAFVYLLGGDIESGNFTIDPMIIEAISVAVYQWQATFASTTFSNDKADINRIFGRDTKTPVTPQQFRDFGPAGIVQAVMVENLGKPIFNNLGFKKKKDVEGNFANKLQVALGELALAYMLDNNIVQQNEISNDKFPNDKTEGSFGESQRNAAQNSTIFIQVKDRDRIHDMIKERRAENNVVDVIGESSFKVFPNKRPTESVPEKMKNSNQNITDDTKETLRKMQKDEWGFKNNVIDGVFNLSQELQDFIFGKVDVNTLHVTQREKAQADNDRIDRMLDDLVTFRENMGRKTSFYMKYFVAKTGRIFFDNNALDPQGDKNVRHLLSLKNFAIIVSNTQQRLQFKMAIAQSFGFDIDKKTTWQVLREFNNILTRTKDAVAILKSGNITPEGEIVIRKALEGGEGIATYEALLALTQYDPVNPFNTNIGIETDAVTSGVAIGIMQTLLDGLEDLPSVGVLLNKVADSFPNWISRVGNNDLYQKLVHTWNKDLTIIKGSNEEKFNITEGAQYIVGSFTNPKGDVMPDGRNAAKYPLMITNYGGSVAAAVRAFSDDTLAQFYKKLAKAKNKEEIDTLIGAASSVISEQISFNHNSDNQLEFVLSFKQEKKFKEAIVSTYGSALTTALEKRLGRFLEFRDNVNNAFQFMFAVFESQFKLKVEAKEKELGRTLSLEEVEAIIDSLQEIAPLAKGPLSKGLDDAMAVLKGGIRRQYAANYKVQVQFSKPLNNTVNNSKSLTSYASTYEFLEPGVAGTVTQIHNMDSVIQQAMLSTVSALNIHDAGFYSLDNVIKGSKTYQEAWLKTNLEFDLGASVLESFERVGRKLKTLSVEERKAAFENLAVRMKKARLPNPENPEGKKVKYDPALHLSQFRGLVTEIRQNKEDLSKEDLTINHIAHNGTSYFNTPGKKPKTVNENAEFSEADVATVEDFIGSIVESIKGSSPDSIDFENFESLFGTTITADTMGAIFEQLENIGHKKDSTEHTARLRELMDNLLNLQGSIDLNVGTNPNDTFGAQRTFEDGSQDIFIVGSTSTKKNNAALSAQEVYIHELLHAMTEYGIDNNTTLRNAIRKLYKKAKAEFTWKDFLPENQTNFNQLEIEKAKEIYDYIFNNEHTEETTHTDPTTGHISTKKVNPYLHEFVAYGLSNDRMAKKLATIEVKNDKRKAKNLLDQLQIWIQDLFEYLINTVAGVKGQTADVALRTLINRMTAVSEKKKFRILEHFSLFDNINQKTVDALYNWIFTPYKNYRKNHTPTTIPGKALRTISGLLDRENHVALGNIIKQVARNLELTERSFIFKLVQELQGPNENTSKWHTLLRISKKVIDQARLTETENVMHQLRNSFHTMDQMTKEENEALYKIFMKLDIAALTDTFEKDKYTPEKLLNILINDDILDRAITDVENQLLGTEYGENARYYLKQARGLGNLMSLGQDFAAGQMQNAWMIANLKTTNRAVRGDLTKAEKLIDELATLYGIQTTNMSHRRAAHSVYQRENDANGEYNGITQLLNLQALNKDMSLQKLFKNNKAQTQKGYTRETYDPNIDIKITTKGKVEVKGKMVKIEDIMKEQGYVQVGNALPKDVHDSSQEDRFMYVAENRANSEWVKSIVSLTSRKAQGTTIEDIYANIQTGTTYQEGRRIVKEIKAKTDGNINQLFRNTEKFEKSKLLPIVNEQGEIVSFRYVMNNDIKDATMKRDNRFDYSMGRMFGSIKDKVNSQTINSQVVAMMHDDYINGIEENPAAFVEMSATTKDKEIQEMYELMPKEMRKELHKAFGKNEPIMIREESLNLIFGFRKLSLKDKDNMVGTAINGIDSGVTWILRNTLFPEAPNANIGRLWTDVIDYVKELIVVRTMVIMLPNFISNQILAFVKGVPISSLARYQTEAVFELNRHQKDTKRRDIIKRELAANTKLSKEKKKDLEVELGHLEDDISNNPVNELIDEGIFQSIIEDVDFEEDIYSNRTKLGDKAKTLADRYLPEYAVDIYRYMYLTRDTKPYQILLKATQMSDFVTRYALFKHRMDNIPKEVKGKEQKAFYRNQVLTEVVESFVNYDVPTSREMQYVNDIGLLMFTKFLFRIQRIIARLFIGERKKTPEEIQNIVDKENRQRTKDGRPLITIDDYVDSTQRARPVSMAAFYGVESMINYNPEDIVESILSPGVIWGRMDNWPGNIFDVAQTPPLIEIFD